MLLQTMMSSPLVITGRILSYFAPELANSNAEELRRDFRGDFARELEEAFLFLFWYPICDALFYGI